MKQNDANVNCKESRGVREATRMILAGDIGGTRTRIGLFDQVPARPRAVAVRSFPTLEYPDLIAILSAFLSDEPLAGAAVDAACFGVAGPVAGTTAQLTNAPWGVDAGRVAKEFSIDDVRLLNDIEAMAYAVPVLQPSELRVLQTGEAAPGGNMALIAAGTGLGEALLHNLDGRFVPSPSEAGHADWAPRTEGDLAVWRSLVERFGRAEVEHVLSGRGLVNLHRVTHAARCPALADDREPAAPAAISAAALGGTCGDCAKALALFVEAYGAEAGNLALRTMATAGLFVGGGIAPKILPALEDGRFMRAFRDKAPFDGLLAAVPVNVILTEQAGLIGAAVYAAGT
jgi:glucokinase